MPKWLLLGFIVSIESIDNFQKKRVCVSENWKVWKYPHKNGKDKKKKWRNLIHVDANDKGTWWKLKHKIHKWIDPWSNNKHSNKGLCQSDSFWALLFV